MEIFFELHSDLPREGPGCNSATRKAFSQLPSFSSPFRVLDIGCGPGIQTIQLSSLIKSRGEIVASDVNQDYLDILREQVTKRSIENINCEIADMFDLKYDEGSFDLVWSEGAIYIIGFEKGLLEWKRVLKPNGFIVVSELSWFSENPPEEIGSFWEAAYPNMKTVGENIEIAQNCGFDMVNHFSLPKSGWLDDYYTPMEKRASMLLEKYSNKQEVIDQLRSLMIEVEMYKKYSDCYGYEFYIMKSTSA